MGVSSGSLINDLRERCDVFLMAAFKKPKRGAMFGVGEENVHGGLVACPSWGLQPFRGAVLLLGASHMHSQWVYQLLVSETCAFQIYLPVINQCAGQIALISSQSPVYLFHVEATGSSNLDSPFKMGHTIGVGLIRELRYAKCQRQPQV